MQSAIPLACFLSMIRPPGIQFENSLLQIAPVDKAKCPFVRDHNDVEFRLYTRHNPQAYQELTVDDDEKLFASSIDFHAPTVIFFHAFMENANDGSASTVREAYILRGDTNVIMVDASSLEAGPWYFTAAENTWYIGKFAAQFIDYLVSRGLDLTKTHLVGHSLGAQAAGVAGASLKSGRVSRITGLDPALPLFAKLPLEQKLDESDAEFVDVIHTDAGIFGVNEPVGHADFYPNGGISPQPGCELEVVIPQHLLLNKCEKYTQPRGFYTYHLTPNKNTIKLAKNIVQLLALHIEPEKTNIFNKAIEFKNIYNQDVNKELNEALKNDIKIEISNMMNNLKHNMEEQQEILAKSEDMEIKVAIQNDNESKRVDTYPEVTMTTLISDGGHNDVKTTKIQKKEETEISKDRVVFNTEVTTDKEDNNTDVTTNTSDRAYDNVKITKIQKKDTELIKDRADTDRQVTTDKVDNTEVATLISDSVYNDLRIISKIQKKEDTEMSKDRVVIDTEVTTDKEDNSTEVTTLVQKEEDTDMSTDKVVIDTKVPTQKQPTADSNSLKHDYEDQIMIESVEFHITQRNATDIDFKFNTTRETLKNTELVTEKTNNNPKQKNHVVKRQKRFLPFFKNENQDDNFLFKMVEFLIKNRKAVVPVFTVMREINTLVKSGNGELNHVSKERNNYIGAPPPILPPITYNLELGNENKAVVFLKRLFGLVPKGDRLTINDTGK